jgi:hypothetical protein
MLSGRRFVAWLLPLLVLLLIAVGVMVALRQTSSRTLRLPDGREFTLKSVTYGTNHVYRSGTPLARMLAPLLSAKLKQRFGVTEVYQQTPVACLIVWGGWTGFKSTTNYPATPAVLVDHTGKQTEWTAPLFIPSTKLSERDFGWKFLNYPRREKVLRFRIFQHPVNAAPEFGGEFLLSNPSSVNYPQWNPPAAPQTVTNGGWECTLLHFAPADLKIQRTAGWGEVEQGYSALFKVRQDKTNALQWSPEFVEILDATGNHLTPAYRATESIAEFKQLRFSSPLWPAEDAWKMKFGFVRLSNFQPQEVISFTNIPAHTASHQVQISTNVSVQEAYISEISLKPYYFLLPIRGGIRPNAQLSLKAAGPALGWHFSLLGLKNQDGRPLAFERGTHVGMEWQFPFKMLAGTKTLSFQLAAQRIQNVEFLAGMQNRSAHPPSGAHSAKMATPPTVGN